MKGTTLTEIYLQREETRNKFGRALCFSFFGIFVLYNFLMVFVRYFANYKFSIDQQTVFISMALTGYISYRSTRPQFFFWPMFRVLTFALYLLVTYLSLVTIHRSMIPCLFYVPILLMVLMQFSIKHTFLASVFTLALCFFMMPASEALGLSKPFPFSQKSRLILKWLAYLIQIISIYLSLLILYFYNALNKIENLLETKKSIDIGNSVPSKKLASQMVALYEKITDFMETHQPYTDPNFSIQALSQKLNSNPTYISRALNSEGGKNFAMFVQAYRVERAKKLMLESPFFSLEEVYRKAGFNQQTTFNRKFREITGSTPSEYRDSIRSSIKLVSHPT